MCLVQLDDGNKRSYLGWKLSPADAPNAPRGADLAAGTYKIAIKRRTKYEDRASDSGKYSYNAATKVINFISGSLAGQYSELLGPGKFGLSAQKTTMFYTVCNLN